MNRSEFIQAKWNPFPSAESGWVDVATWLENGRSGTVVCGRLKKLSATDAQVESGGKLIEIHFHKQTQWLQPQREPIEFDFTLFETGDLVALKLTEDLQPFGVQQVLLLAPMLRELKLESGFTVDTSKSWSRYLQAVRDFFVDRKFIEASTPTLVPSPGTEPFLDPFETEWHFGSWRQTFYLPTSPEFHLKKLLVRGWTRVFEFKPCFRNGEISEHHQPEFWMLEWYRAYSNLDAIADDVGELIQSLAAAAGRKVPQLKRVTMVDLFRQAFQGFELKASTSRDELVALANREGISVASDDSFDDVFFRLFLEKIEGNLGMQGPLLVRGYPPSQAALSRIGADGFADRFEVYWNGLELANAFHELNNPSENEARFRDDAKRKQELGKPGVPVDEELVSHLYHGMPPSGGIALGLDRLFMALYGISEISETRAFPIKT